MRTVHSVVGIAIAMALVGGRVEAGTESPEWSAYLDYAYVYSSAEPELLRKRLQEYAEEAGTPLDRYISEYFETLVPLEGEDDEAQTRRRAIAYLVHYFASGDTISLDRSVETIRELEDRLGRYENRYWYHYILAHEALEKGQTHVFVEQLLAMWVRVVAPLEMPFEMLRTLSLSEAPNSGFVSALPYVYENITRLVLLRSQRTGLDRDLDPLGAIVRLLHDKRVGAHPDVIPPAASSRDYLDRIMARLDGPESDDGSLTFTLVLFEAGKLHDRARSLLATDGLGQETLRAIRATTAAYATALKRAHTLQGECAVFTRALRQLGEIYAAKQRLGVDPEIESPFSIDGAIEVYRQLYAARNEGWQELGYRNTDRQAYLEAMRGLWEEIQESGLNAADYYLSQAVATPDRADEQARAAVRIFTRYLSFFHRYATVAGKEAVPDSAYFAAFEAARGIGDGFLAYASSPRRAEIELATKHYRSALILFPFDRELWPALTSALEQHGREGDYMSLVRPITDWVVRSRSVDAWIGNGEPHSAQIESLRRGLADSLVVTYMGFADASGIGELEQELLELRARRTQVERGLAELTRRRDRMMGRTGAAPPAAPDREGSESPPPGVDPLEFTEVARKLVEAKGLLGRIDGQISARSQALPLYKATLETDGMTQALRGQRDHPVHTLLRRMYYENRP